MALRRWLVAFAVFGLVLAACSKTTTTVGNGGTGSANKSPIEIGYLASTTGFCSTFSQGEVEGARLAVDTINGQGGVLGGHPLVLNVRDDQATPSVGVQQARDLVLSNGIKLLAGTCASNVGLAVRKSVADPSHVLYIAPVGDYSVFSDVGKTGSFVFGTLPPTTVEGATLASFVKSQNVHKVAFIGEDYSYSFGVFKAFQQGLQGSNVQIISHDFATVSDYTPYINKMLSEKPDFVYSNLVVNDLDTFVKQAQTLGLFKQLGPKKFIGFFDLSTLLATGKAPPVGELGYDYYPEPYLFPGKSTNAFADQIKASTGSVATGGDGDGFNQIQMIAQGIDKAGSSDPAKVAAALSGATVNLVQGPLAIRTCDHLPEGPVAIGVISGPTKQIPFNHIADPTLVKTGSLYPPC